MTSKRPDTAYIVMRHIGDENDFSEWCPVAIHTRLEDAEDMADSYQQDVKDRGIRTINFSVFICAFYD